MSLRISELTAPGPFIGADAAYDAAKKNPAEAVMVGRGNPQEPRASREKPAGCLAGGQDPVQVQNGNLRAIEREAMKLAIQEQTLRRQIALSSTIANAAGALQQKCESLLTHVMQRTGSSGDNQKTQDESTDKPADRSMSRSIEEKALNALERRINEYESLVAKLGERCTALFTLYNEAAEVTRELNDSNRKLVEHHLAVGLPQNNGFGDRTTVDGKLQRKNVGLKREQDQRKHIKY